ncbi:MAG: flagellar type III secretion system pore protein FliP [Planctomycetia bacterium]|nr:flagellar type III secretion system pore protein FliP [Planctomycetia bacterium]
MLVTLKVFLTLLAVVLVNFASCVNAQDSTANRVYPQRNVQGVATIGAGAVEEEASQSYPDLDAAQTEFDDAFPSTVFIAEEIQNPTAPSQDLLSPATGRAQWDAIANLPGHLLSPQGFTGSLSGILIVSIFTVAPAILLMTTSYARISVVLGMLRQGLGVGQIPSNQVLTALAVFLSALIMTPTWSVIYREAVAPYASGELTARQAFDVGQAPLREFMWKQIERSGNVETIDVFMAHIPNAEPPQYFEDVPWRALAPAFLLSELKTAFLIGFQILLPFLIIDLVVSAVLVSTGMMMLPPAMVSLPFKVALFVLADGWTLVVKSLLASFNL